MDLKDLEAIGKYLYGHYWKCYLAEDLGIGDSTLRAVCSGTRRLKETTQEDIYRLAATHQLKEIVPLLTDIKLSGELPPVFKLTPVKRTWSLETDIRIKEILVQRLKEHEINCEVGEG